VKTDDGKKNPAPGIQLTGKEEKSIVNYSCINYWRSDQLLLYESVSQYAFCLSYAHEFKRYCHLSDHIDTCFISGSINPSEKGIEIKSSGWIKGGVKRQSMKR